MFDNSPESSLELLRFNRRFGDRPTFENALRRRVEELDGFGHPSIAKVRAVEWLGPGEGLALVSNHTPGRRLSEVLHDARGAAFAMELVRQLTPALASLQQQGQGIAHGALTAERIVVTPEGRLVIVEHVLGSALESLEMPASRLRGDLGIAVRDDASMLDARSDVVQLGLVALSLLLGRRVDAHEYPDKAAALLAESAWGHRGSSASTALLGWLERALQVSTRTFGSAQEAHDGLNELSDERAMFPTELRRPLHAFTMAISAGESVSLLPLIVHEPTEEPVVAERTTRIESVPRSASLIDYPRPLPPDDVDQVAEVDDVGGVGPVSDVTDVVEITDVRDVVASTDVRDVGADAPTQPLPSPWPLVSSPYVAAPPPPAPPARPAERVSLLRTDRAEFDSTSRLPPRTPVPSSPPPPVKMHFSGAKLAIIGLSILAGVEALFIAGLLYGRPSWAGGTQTGTTSAATTPAPTPTPEPLPAIPLASPAPQVAGLTPPPAPTSSTPAPETATRSTAPVAAGPTRMEITSDPPGARVSVDGTQRGITPLLLAVRPGAHAVIITDGNSTTTRNVNVLEGSTATIMTTFAPAGAAAGWLSISSPIDLQVHESATLIGTTAMARLMLPAGRHNLEVSNEALGFTTTIAVDIQPGKMIQTTVAVPNGSLSINALPWANVWLDGRALGTTPIANLDVPLGTHEIIWRHPQFGERKQTVVVTAKAPVRLMMDLSK